MPNRRFITAALLLFLLTASAQAAAPNEVTVKVGETSVTAYINDDGRTLVPARFIAEALKAKVAWDPDTKTVTITQEPRVITLRIGEARALVDGREVQLDTRAEISPEGRTMVPLRFIAEALGQGAQWDAATRTVGLVDAVWLERAPTPAFGNTFGNLNTGGWAATKGNWVFFSNLADQGRLYRMRLDGSEVKRLTDDPWVFHINVQGDWIYHAVQQGSGTVIRKVRLDGTQPAVLVPEEPTALLVAGERLYFISRTDGQRLSSVALDGTGRTRLTDVVTSELIVHEGWIYYRGRYQGDELWRMRVDGTENQRIAAHNAMDLALWNGGLYYFNPVGYPTYELTRTALDGSESSPILAGPERAWVNLDQGWIYYAAGSYVGAPLYRIRVDGTDEQLLTSDRAARITVIPGWILYEDVQNSGRLMRIRPDGTNRERLTGAVWRPAQ